MKIPAPNEEISVYCPVCGMSMVLNIKVDDGTAYWGKAGYCHQVSATYTPSSDGKVEVVAYFQPAR